MPTEQSDQIPASSEGIETQDVAADEAVARSSDASQDEGPKSMADAVRAVLEPEPEDPAESSPAERVEAEAEPEGEPEEPADRDATLLKMLDELKDPKTPLHKLERFREVLSENKALRSQFEAVRPAIDRLAEVNDAARRVGLTPDEVAEFFHAPILANENPAKAHEIVSKFAERLAQAAGAKLPDDLRREVDDGYITEERAKEVALLRAEAERSKSSAQFESELAQRQQVQQRQEKIVSAVNEYQTRLMSSDPSYTPAKHAMVKEALELLVIREGRPDSPEKAVELAKRAHDTVSKRLAEFAPRPRELRQPSGRRINAPAQTAPKSMKEAVERALSG